MALRRRLAGALFLTCAHCAWIAPVDPVNDDDAQGSGGVAATATVTTTGTMGSGGTNGSSGAGGRGSQGTVVDFSDGVGYVEVDDGTTGTWSWVPFGMSPVGPSSVGPWEGSGAACTGPFLGDAGTLAGEAAFEVRFTTPVDASHWEGVEAEVWMSTMTWKSCFLVPDASDVSLMTDCAPTSGTSKWVDVRAKWAELPGTQGAEIDPAALSGLLLAFQGDLGLVCVHAIRFFR